MIDCKYSTEGTYIAIRESSGRYTRIPMIYYIHKKQKMDTGIEKDINTVWVGWMRWIKQQTA